MHILVSQFPTLPHACMHAKFFCTEWLNRLFKLRTYVDTVAVMLVNVTICMHAATVFTTDHDQFYGAVVIVPYS